MMKKIAICFVLLLGLNLSGYSQGNPEERAEKLIEKLDEKLDLSQEKKDGITAIFTDFFTSMKEAGKGNKSEMKSLAETRDEKVQELLDEDEYVVYTEMMKKSQQQRPKRRND